VQRLDPDELADLGRFLSRRVPCPSPEGWASHLAHAQDDGSLDAILATAAEACDDPRLREVRRLITDDERPVRSGLAPLVVAAGAAAVLTVALTAFIGIAAMSGVEAEAAPALRAVTVARVAPPVAELAAPVAPEAALEAAPEAAPVAEVAPEALPAVASPAPPEPAPVPVRRSTSACAHAGIAGWWYAGDHAPGAVGDVITVPRDTNVRAKPPGHDNRFDAHTRIRCVLGKGQRVRLSAAAVLVPPGAYWVPFSAADVDPS
jgi:hypothetical protein